MPRTTHARITRRASAISVAERFLRAAQPSPEVTRILKDLRQELKGSRILRKALLDVARKMAEDTPCERLSDFEGRINPDIDTKDIAEHLLEEVPRKKTPLLDFVNKDPKVKALTEAYLAAVVISDPDLDAEAAAEDLDESLFDEYFVKAAPKGIEGDELEDVYDDLRDSCRDQMELERDPYSYYGVRRRDFYASRRASKATIHDIAAFMKGKSTRVGGPFMRAKVDPGTVILEPKNRVRLDYFDLEGSSSEAWENGYANPIREEVSRLLAREFQGQKLLVDVDDKGFVYIEDDTAKAVTTPGVEDDFPESWRR